jgi:hybrid polyketide synthase/nonribosomal peptide synthetase ACE1
VSSGFFEEAEEKFKEYANRMIFKTFDMQRTPADQGFVEGSYDMVLASNVLHVADPLENMMSNVRRLLKPGGFLVNLETVTNEILRNGVIMGGLPGWWIAANSGRPHGPMLNLDHWDSLLKKCQFGGIETSTPIYDQLHAVAVWAAQAVDDRLELLRNPIASLPDSYATGTPPLILIGGRSLATYQLVEEVAASLSSKFSSLVRLPSIESLKTVTIPDGATVLSLSELDEPLMRQVTEEKIEGLKALWRCARNIVWVSKGARAEQPYSYMMFGIGRVVKFEQPNINLQLLDLDVLDKETGSVISTMVLRHQLIDDYSRQGAVEDLLWSSEPEVFIENKQTLIPRLYPSVMQNLRVNSSSRAIFEQVNPAKANVKLVGSGDSFQLEEASPLRVTQSKSSSGAPVMIRIRQSLLQFINLESIGSFMLCTGTKEDDSKSAVIALTRVSESPAPVEPLCWVDIPSSLEFGRMALLSVAAQLVAQAIVSLVSKASTVVIHDPDNLVKRAISQAADNAHVNVKFTTCRHQPDGADWIWIHRALPARLVKEKLPQDTSVFVNFAAPDGPDAQVTQTMAACLSASCVVANADLFFTNELSPRPGANPSQSGDILQRAWKSVMENSLPISSTDSILLSDVGRHNPRREPLQIVDWTVPTIQIRLRPVDHEVIFRSDRTYLLIGLAGEVGQSICQWMARCGAGCIVLTSRNPKVDPEFIRSVEECGTSVRVLSLYVIPSCFFLPTHQSTHRLMAIQGYHEPRLSSKMPPGD